MLSDDERRVILRPRTYQATWILFGELFPSQRMRRYNLISSEPWEASVIMRQHDLS
jgi:hypothetical protein